MPLINCKFILDLNKSEKCRLTTANNADQDNIFNK